MPIRQTKGSLIAGIYVDFLELHIAKINVILSTYPTASIVKRYKRAVKKHKDRILDI